jgi:hypothetical protein
MRALSARELESVCLECGKIARAAATGKTERRDSHLILGASVDQ